MLNAEGLREPNTNKEEKQYMINNSTISIIMKANCWLTTVDVMMQYWQSDSTYQYCISDLWWHYC